MLYEVITLVQAEAGVDQADSLFDPSLSANAGITRARLSKLDDYTGQGNRISNTQHLGLDFNYSFDLWGGKRDTWEASVNKLSVLEERAGSMMLVFPATEGLDAEATFTFAEGSYNFV